jgi:hypothetical protein
MQVNKVGSKVSTVVPHFGQAMEPLNMLRLRNFMHSNHTSRSLKRGAVGSTVLRLRLTFTLRKP